MKVIKRFAQWVIGLILALLFVFLIQYLFAPVYDFPQPQPFSGSKLFNPYQGLNRPNWRKANFQVQSASWFGITDGRKNSSEMIDSTYRFLDYDVICISDYMKINTYKQDEDPYIPVYEHGYNLWKRHQVCIGAQAVNWRDYAFYQNMNHKQHIVNLLRDQTDLTIIAHPNYEDGWEASDFKWLRNYDGVEILNYFRQSIEHWDSALSAGYYVIGIGDDDVHDITNPNQVGQYCTFIYSESLKGDSLIQAMKAGKVYAAHIHREYNESFEKKKKMLQEIPELKYARLVGDTLWVKVNRKAHIFKFIGQDGQIRKQVQNLDSASYTIQGHDTYIRTQIHFDDGNTLYLGPVARYSGTWPPHREYPVINPVKTWIYRVLFGASLLFIIVNIIFIKRRLVRKT